MENINTEIRYEIVEQLDDGRFVAKVYDWWPDKSVVKSYNCGDVKIGIRNCRLVERVMDLTFSVPNKGFKPEIGATYDQRMYYRVYDIHELFSTIKNTGRVITWKEPFVSYFSENSHCIEDATFSVNELFKIVREMKNTSTVKTIEG